MNKEKKHNLVYKTTNLINDKIYIGVHCTGDLDDGYIGSGKLLRYAIKKYGKENFKRSILHDFITAESAYGVEAVVVDEYFISRDDNYNTRLGGLHSYHKEDTGLKISNANKGRISKLKGIKTGKPAWNKGLKLPPLSEEQKEKISNVLKGKKKTIETRIKMSKAQRGKIVSEETCKKISIKKKGQQTSLGRILSEDTKEKIRQSRLGKKLSEEHKIKIGNASRGRKFPNGYKKKDISNV